MTTRAFNPRAGTAALAGYAAGLLHQIAGGVPVATNDTQAVEIFRRSDWMRRMADLETLPLDSRDILQRTLKAMRVAGNWRRVAPAPDPAAVLALTERHPHFQPLIEEIADEAALARRAPKGGFRIRHRILAGEAGTGKTTFARDLARVLGVDTIFLSMGGATAGFAIGGLSLGWSTAQPGQIHMHLACKASALANSIVILDELDKARGDERWSATGVLYTLLEPTSARHFRDEAIQIALDAGWLNYIATANEIAAIEPALRSRFSVFTVPLPTPRQAAQIAHHIYSDLRASHDWGSSFAESLGDDVAEALSDHRPRTQTQLLRRAFAKAARAGRAVLVPSDFAVANADAVERRGVYAGTGTGFTADLSARRADADLQR